MLSELFGGISYNKKNKNRNYMVTWRYEISLLVLKQIFHENERNFVTPSDHVIIFFFVLLHKILAVQQKMLNSFYFKS